jgi:hypothetical protein
MMHFLLIAFSLIGMLAAPTIFILAPVSNKRITNRAK